MKRTAVFAHYDKNNLIQDYVVYYLSELKKCAEKIIFVSDSDVLPEELKKMANDSCYAPLFPFEEMFSAMSKKPLDFWGATSSDSGIKKEDENVYCRFNHIQSYFVVFKPAVFNSDIFNKFITSIKK